MFFILKHLWIYLQDLADNGRNEIMLVCFIVFLNPGRFDEFVELSRRQVIKLRLL